MKHFTCDKCGYPMEKELMLRIGITIYDICNKCSTEIFNGLEGKGRQIPPMQQIQEYAAIYNIKNPK